VKKKIIFICGSVNQTSMMHQISEHFPEYDCHFTPYYAGGIGDWLMRFVGISEISILGGDYRQRTVDYLQDHHLPTDERAEYHRYDFAVTCQDLVWQTNLRDIPHFMVQEGMTSPANLRFYLYKLLRLPRWVTGTQATGLSDYYDLLFVASEGFRRRFIKRGVRPEKVRVTGIPNFDDFARLLDNDFPHRHYVLAATTNHRESAEYENRKKFIKKAVRIAAGRPLIFKLHPFEDHQRATREIERWAPGARIFATGNTDHMIANCDVLVTRFSTVLLVALALGKDVHAELPPEDLVDLAPIQNGGTSAKTIADTIKRHLEQKSAEYVAYHRDHDQANRAGAPAVAPGPPPPRSGSLPWSG
jgi:hypothetical protein